MKLRTGTFLALAGVITLLPGPARADGASYNFGGCTDAPVVCSGDVGSVTANYTSNGHTITAKAFSIANYDLFIKNGNSLPADEQGLGMMGTTDHEIQHGEFIQLDVTSLAQAGFTTVSLILDSVQPSEGYQICVSNVAGSDSGHCFTGHLDLSPVTVNFGSGYNYIDVTATTGDVLIAKGLVATREPSSLMLLGSGLLALVGFTLKKAIA
jgi:hypothetical protein